MRPFKDPSIRVVPPSADLAYPAAPCAPQDGDSAGSLDPLPQDGREALHTAVLPPHRQCQRPYGVVNSTIDMEDEITVRLATTSIPVVADCRENQGLI